MIHASAAVAATYDTWLRINRMIRDVFLYFLSETGVRSKQPVDRSIRGTLFTGRPDQLAATPSALETAASGLEGFMRRYVHLAINHHMIEPSHASRRTFNFQRSTELRWCDTRQRAMLRRAPMKVLWHRRSLSKDMRHIHAVKKEDHH